MLLIVGTIRLPPAMLDDARAADRDLRRYEVGEPMPA